MDGQPERASSPAAETLVVVEVFDRFTPDEMFAYWTQPDLLTRWWPHQAEIEPRPGGRYHLSWPEMSWDLRGQYTAFQPDERLAFTWSWDHEPEAEPQHVAVRFEPEGEGTRVTVHHGPHADTPEGREQRNGNLEGWTHFLGKLRALKE